MQIAEQERQLATLEEQRQLARDTLDTVSVSGCGGCIKRHGNTRGQEARAASKGNPRFSTLRNQPIQHWHTLCNAAVARTLV